MSPFYGGDERNRTADPLLARQVLSQLSYTPTSDELSLFISRPSSELRAQNSGFLAHLQSFWALKTNQY